MVVDTKIEVDFICPYCKSRIQLRKKKEASALNFNCPSCEANLRVSFNVNASPQTYKVENEDVREKKGKTVYGRITGKNRDFDDDPPINRDDDSPKKGEKNSSKTRIYRATPKKEPIAQQNEEPEKHVTPHKKKRKLKTDIYLTQLKWFGMKDQQYSLYEGENIVGRYDPEQPSDIAIRGDELMSRRSVVITIEEEHDIYKLKVLNATNKVKVNGVQVKEGYETYLELGDIITMGNTKFRFDNH